MNLSQLRVVVAVSELGSFTDAAKALKTVQSNISTHVAQLEHELGVLLVERNTHELTEAGHVVVARARRALAECDSILTDTTSRQPADGKVRIGMIGTTAGWLAPLILDTIAVRHPALHLVITEGTSTSLARQLDADDIDAAVLSAHIDTANLSLTHLFDEELLLVLPAGHHLARQARLGIEALDQIDLLLPPPATAYRPLLDSVAAAHNITLRAKAEFESIRLIASLTLNDHGPAILPATAISRSLREHCPIIPVAALPPRHVVLAHTPVNPPSPATRAVIEIARCAVAKRTSYQPAITTSTSCKHDVGA